MGAAAVGLATGVGVLAFSHLHRGSSRAGSVRSVLVSARLHVSVGGDSRSRLLLLGFQRLALRYAAGCYWLPVRSGPLTALCGDNSTTHSALHGHWPVLLG